MNWFREGWLKEDHRAIGAYIGILYAYFRFRERAILISEVYPRHREVSAHFTRYNIPEVMSIIDEIVKSFTNDKELEEIEKKNIIPNSKMLG